MDQPKPESAEPSPESDFMLDFSKWKNFVEELKKQWKHLWWTRIDDKVRAEGIARDDFPRLFVERGTIIIATRDYKPPIFREILTKHMPTTIADQANPGPAVGGISKFIRNVILKQKPPRRAPPPKPKSPEHQQRKHGGRGWLHYTLE